MAESSEPIAVTRTEDDIPGAKLFEPWERHTNHALWWWLLCHGIQVPVSLTKAKFNGTTWDTMHRNRIPRAIDILNLVLLVHVGYVAVACRIPEKQAVENLLSFQ